MLIKKIIKYGTALYWNIKFAAKHIFFSFLMIFCLHTHAEYVATLTDGKQKAWVDTSSKEGTGNIRRIMELINYKEKQIPKQGLEYYSIIYQYQFDCSKKVFKVLMSVAFEKHQAQGKAIFRDDTATPTYMGIRDGSSIYEAHAIACR